MLFYKWGQLGEFEPFEVLSSLLTAKVNWQMTHNDKWTKF